MTARTIWVTNSFLIHEKYINNYNHLLYYSNIKIVCLYSKDLLQLFIKLFLPWLQYWIIKLLKDKKMSSYISLTYRSQILLHSTFGSKLYSYLPFPKNCITNNWFQGLWMGSYSIISDIKISKVHACITVIFTTNCVGTFSEFIMQQQKIIRCQLNH